MRLKPLSNDKDEGDSVIQKISNSSLSINSHSFAFDSILHADATQARFICCVYILIPLLLLDSWIVPYCLMLFFF